MLVLVEQAARLQWFSNAESIDKQYLKRWRFCGCLGIVRLSRYKSWSLSAGDWGDWDDYDWKGSTASKSSKSGKSSKSYDSYDYSYGYGSYSSYKDNGTYDYKGQVGHAELWHWAIWAISVYLDILVKPTAPGFFCGFETVYIVYIYIFFLINTFAFVGMIISTKCGENLCMATMHRLAARLVQSQSQSICAKRRRFIVFHKGPLLFWLYPEGTETKIYPPCN